VEQDRPILIFGGAYGNLQATEAVLEEAGRRGITPDRIICTGDLAAYCGEPAETIQLIRQSGIRVVMGNCDEQLANGTQDCGCFFPQGSGCERLSREWFAHANRAVSEEDRAWLASLPRRIDITLAGRRLAVVHGSVSGIKELVFASTSAAHRHRELMQSGADGIIAGHCGLPFTQVIGGRLWHNAGVVGMPANDGTPRVWFSMLTPRDGAIEIEHVALGYDHVGAAAAMERAGLSHEYRDALASGLWPSSDVLPYRELRERGVALVPGAVTWADAVPRQPKRRQAVVLRQLWPAENRDGVHRLNPAKFVNPRITAAGQPRATVGLERLEMLWFNTGTLCNITCRNCYIESSPRNGRLAYIGVGDVEPFLDEIERDRLGTPHIGFTGGEPFMNPQMLDILELVLSRGFRALVLTNAMRPMQRIKAPLAALCARYRGQLGVRVSLDHYRAERHEDERGDGTFKDTFAGLLWLASQEVALTVAGRTMWGEAQDAARQGYQRLFDRHAIAIDAADPTRLVLFPEMNARDDVPEISTACWGILHKSPSDLMCASQRMVIRRQGAAAPVVMPCTLIAYDTAFEMGATLAEATGDVALNHPHCAQFCVLGGASCAPQKSDTLTTA
jgi:predicted phosphodiesterase